MKVVIDLDHDSDNTEVSGDATLVGNGRLITIRLTNPERNVAFRTRDLARAIDALASED